MEILSEVLSSRRRAQIFNLLFGLEQNEYYVRDIQRKTSLAVSTISQEMKNLLTLGLILKRISGNRTYYKANKEHFLYKTINELVIKTIGLTDLLKRDLDMDNIKFAFIFGSVATGKFNNQSDIDLFVIGDVGLKEISRALRKSRTELDREINTNVMTEDEYSLRKKENDHFISAIEAGEKILFIGNEDDFTKLGE